MKTNQFQFRTKKEHSIESKSGKRRSFRQHKTNSRIATVFALCVGSLFYLWVFYLFIYLFTANYFHRIWDIFWRLLRIIRVFR